MRSLTSAILALAALTLAPLGLADPLSVKFTSCLSDYPSQLSPEALMNVTNVYANIAPPDVAQFLGLVGGGARPVLRVDLIGSSGAVIEGYSNETGKLATLFHDTDAAHISVWDSASWLCPSILPSQLPFPYTDNNSTYCPLPAGPFALNISIPLYRSYALTTLRTQVRVVDTTAQANTLACYDLEYTPWVQGAWYYQFFRWFPVSIAIGIWLATWGARFAAGWVVGSGVAEYEVKEGHGVAAAKRDARMRKWGTMIVSGLSGERLSVSGGLLRFATPGLRDIIQYIQFTTILAMVAVNWPDFAYPIITRGAWADLIGNVTVISDSSSHHLSGYPNDYNPPSDFAKLMSNTHYPIYLDPSAYNPLFDLHGSSPGMQSFATAIGMRDTDLFGTCLIVFLSIAAGVTIISLLLWTAHAFVEYLSPNRKTRPISYNKRQSSQMSSLGLPTKESSEGSGFVGLDLEGLHSEPRAQITSPSRFRKVWFRFRPKGEAGAFHAAALYGNLLRLILMFHLPITALSIYQLALSQASIVSRVFAALAFVFISVLIPALIMWKIYKTASGKLYDATRTLLSLGTMYNVYIEGKQMFRVFPLVASLVEGIVIGAGQQSGLAQSVVLIVVELVMLIMAAFWYPWGEGASMGAPNAFLGITRVITVVLMMLLSEEFAITDTVTDWFTYVILILQAIVFVFFFFMLLTKIVEGLIRLFGGVPFDESTSPLDGGLFAAIMDLDCFNGGRGGKAAARRERKRGSQQLQKNVYAAGSLTTQMMLDRNSQGVPRQDSEGNMSYLTSYNSFGEASQAAGYLPVNQPPLGPPPSNNVKRSFEDENANEPIMNAWRPPVASPTSPPTAGQSFSVVRGGRADFNNPYSVKDGSPSQRSYSPAGPSSQPISAIPSPSQSPRPLLNPTLSHGLRPNNQGLMPPQLSIPKRRSLNDLKEDNSPTSAYPESPKKRPKGKRLSSGPKGWFARRGEDDSPSESEEEDPRRPQPFAAVPSPLGQKRGWRSALGLTKRQEDESMERRDENKVRKDALAAQSGSLFAGVEAPRSGFVVRRKEAKAKGRDIEPWKESGPQRFSLATRGEPSGSGTSTPRISALEKLEGGRSNGEPETKGFKVKRMNRGSGIAPPLAVPLKAEAPMIQLAVPETRPGPADASGSSSASSSINNGRTSHGIVKSLPASGLKRSSNVVKSPTDGPSLKSPISPDGRAATGPPRRGSAGGGLWGDLGEFGASQTDPNAVLSGRRTSKVTGPPIETVRGKLTSPISPDAPRITSPTSPNGPGKSFKVRRSKQYTPPVAPPPGTSQPTSSFSVRRPRVWSPGAGDALPDLSPANRNASTSSVENFGYDYGGKTEGRPTSSGSNGPDRPPKNPRRISQDSPRL